MRRKHQVVMLATEKAIENGIIKVIKSIHKGFTPEGQLLIAKRSERGNKLFDAGVNNSSYNKALEPQHLYILSDEEIKEGDWYILIPEDKVKQYKGNFLNTPLQTHRDYKKIIATTNPELNIKYLSKGSCEGEHTITLPQISQDFIEAYIKEYNAGNVIKEVMVEYTDMMNTYISINDLNKVNEIMGKLKLRPNNTIYISKVKEKTYSRDELKQALKLLNDNLPDSYSIMSDNEFEEYFNENYPE